MTFVLVGINLNICVLCSIHEHTSATPWHIQNVITSASLHCPWPLEMQLATPEQSWKTWRTGSNFIARGRLITEWVTMNNSSQDTRLKQLFVKTQITVRHSKKLASLLARDYPENNRSQTKQVYGGKDKLCRQFCAFHKRLKVNHSSSWALFLERWACSSSFLTKNRTAMPFAFFPDILKISQCSPWPGILNGILSKS